MNYIIYQGLCDFAAISAEAAVDIGVRVNPPLVCPPSEKQIS